MKYKLFGIGATLLMVLLAAAPAITGAPLGTQTGQQPVIDPQVFNPNEKKILKDEVMAFYYDYEEYYNEIEAYVDEYIAEHGGIDENFEFSEEIMLNLEYLQEILDERIGGMVLPTGGGINDFRIIYPYFMLWVLIGTLFQLWTDHEASQFLAEIWDQSWPLAISTLVDLFCFPLGTAISLVIGILIEFGYMPDEMNPWIYYDHGNGVITNFWKFGAPHEAMFVPMFTWVESQ